MHRHTSIEKDANVSFRFGKSEQATKNAQRLLRSSRHLQGSYLQRQDRDDTPHARNLLGTAEQRHEPLQGLRILLLRQVDICQGQVCAFAAV